MARNTATIGLILALLLTTAGLGLVLGGGAGIGNDSLKGPPQASSVAVNPLLGPILLVKAETVASTGNFAVTGNSTFFTVSGNTGPNGSNFTITPQTTSANKSQTLEPLAGVDFAVQGLQSFSGALRGPVLSYSVVTNSSGMGEISVPPGNFSVTARGPNFSFGELLPFKQNQITSLTLEVTPTFGDVVSVYVQNPDTISGVEPTGTIYAEVAGNVSYALQTPTQLVGDEQGPIVSQTSLDVTVLGYYRSPQGTLVVLRPSGPYSALPFSGISLVQYKTNSTVKLIAI
jgi:hypothetical protein